MPERDYAATPVSDALGLRAIIDGLAGDLQDVRNGQITPADAMARAALAKQIFNGCRLYLNAMSIMARAQPPAREMHAIEGKSDA